MFKKLEDWKTEKILGKSSSQNESCGCICKAVQAIEKEPMPESTQALTAARTAIDING